ncbi:24694_t:CDS:2 [Cetraspora pellucida]|uniref:24694_t:CDS:1 n=1 Tax=Cetraspora pellucida TaxID=1433469 RepID=A0A9N9DCM5_9GLOM|nr:24694_t:CDS:2 [Cetraspora pellucida]
MKSQIGNLQNQLQAAKTEITNLKQENQNLEATNTLYAQQIKLIDPEKEKLNAQLVQNKIEQLETQRKLNQLEVEKQDLKNRLAHTKQTIQNSKFQKEQFEKQLEQQQLFNLEQKRVRQLKAKQEELKETKKKLEYQLAFTKDNTAPLHKELKEREQELKETTNELKKVQEKDLDQIKNYLGVKKVFLNARKITIKGLQNCYNKLKSNKKHTKVDEISNLIVAVGGVANSLTFGIPKAFGDTIKAINKSFERKFSDRWADEFKNFLDNDRKNLALLNKIIEKIACYLTRIIQEKSISIWEGKPFSKPEEMEKAITLLNDNFEKLETQLAQEENKFKEIINKASEKIV